MSKLVNLSVKQKFIGSFSVPQKGKGEGEGGFK